METNFLMLWHNFIDFHTKFSLILIIIGHPVQVNKVLSLLSLYKTSRYIIQLYQVCKIINIFLILSENRIEWKTNERKRAKLPASCSHIYEIIFGTRLIVVQPFELDVL